MSKQESTSSNKFITPLSLEQCTIALNGFHESTDVKWSNVHVKISPPSDQVCDFVVHQGVIEVKGQLIYRNERSTAVQFKSGISYGGIAGVVVFILIVLFLVVDTSASFDMEDVLIWLVIMAVGCVAYLSLFNPRTLVEEVRRRLRATQSQRA